MYQNCMITPSSDNMLLWVGVFFNLKKHCFLNCCIQYPEVVEIYSCAFSQLFINFKRLITVPDIKKYKCILKITGS
jgi:hypothetical protein